MKKGSRAAGIGKGSGPKPRQKISDITDFEKKMQKVRQMSTKTSNPRCKINFGNLTFRILILQTTWFWLFLQDLGTKSKFGFGTLILQTTWLTAYLHDFGQNPDSVLGPLSSKPPGLQQSCMILGQNPDSVFGSWSSKHLQTTLFTVYLHDLGTKSRFNFRILILQTSCFTAYLHDLGTKSRFSFRILILQKKGWNKCIQMSTKTSNPRCKINFGNLTFRILTLVLSVFVWFWD